MSGDFEDITQLMRCIRSDCDRSQAGGTQFCAQHLGEQMQASATGYVEPELEAKANAAYEAELKREQAESGVSQTLMDPDLNGGMMATTDAVMREVAGEPVAGEPVDPLREDVKAFRRALRGKMGSAAQAVAELALESIRRVAE